LLHAVQFSVSAIRFHRVNINPNLPNGFAGIVELFGILGWLYGEKNEKPGSLETSGLQLRNCQA